MKKRSYLLLLVSLLISLLGFGQDGNDEVCLYGIRDTIWIKYKPKKIITILNDSILINGQEYCIKKELIKSIDISKIMSSEVIEKIETVILDIKINADHKKLVPKFYINVDSVPEFVGGKEKMMNFIFKNFKDLYPQDVRGKVYIQFVVSENGVLSDIKIARGFDPTFDKELLRVFSIMPDWNPGILNGKLVPVRLVLPIDLSLH
jgi:hypothetical protein